MTVSEIKAALIDGATVRVVGIGYADTYSVVKENDGTALVAYANEEVVAFDTVFADIDRASSRFGARAFRCVTDEGDVTITIVIELGEEC